MNAIDVQGLVKRFGGKTVVDDVSMTVERGEIVGFLGPNGSGKTTTIRMMCGLLTPDAGERQGARLRRPTESLKIKREVGYMTQRFSLYEDLTIAENLDLRRAALPPRRSASMVDDTLDELGLDDAARPARRHALGRLEAAAGARRLHHARAASCCCSTSRPPASTPRRGASSGTRSTGWPPAA